MSFFGCKVLFIFDSEVLSAIIFFLYVFQIADGMTLQVKVVNLLLETGGGAHREGGAAW